ncbi:MAG TPA: thymidine kinase [Bacteroidia bacterium]|nr:thymidine kinase [Bacteroidia bacterium]
MFLENPRPSQHRKGSIEVVCGSMFSGKTEELIRRMKRAQIAKLKVEIFKPTVDNRYHEVKVVSHDANEIHSTPVATSADIPVLAKDVDVVGIDEAQFFDSGIIRVCSDLADRGVRVIVAGLDMDFKGNPFGPIPDLLAIAEHVTKVHAICMRCGNPANHSHRMSGGSELVQLGEKDSYEPLCRDCFRERTKGKKD